MAMPRDERSDMEAVAENVLEMEDLRVSFYTEEGEVRAVDGVSFSIPRGSIVGLVGESGCGK
jgi:peptide/nickel transport system ATP-binding protein